MQRHLTLVMVLVASFAFIAVNILDADAANRKGSRRVYSGHGKGSHYVGGETATKQKKTSTKDSSGPK